MVILITFALWEKEGSVEVVGLEDADTSMDGVIGFDADEKVSNKSIISDVHSDLVFDKRDDELALLDPLMLPLRACPDCGSNK